MNRILVVEDDRELNEAVCAYLNRNGFEVVGCLSANSAYNAMYGNAPFSLIVTDIMMPGIDGFEFAKTIRAQNQDVPIVFTTARDDFLSKERGFRIGIDDYMIKPVDLDELLLRIGAILRRVNIASTQRLTIGNLILDSEERTVILGDQEIPMTMREFNLLHKLLSNPRKTFTRKQLMDEFWDPGTTAGSRTVDVYITKLLEKLSQCDDIQIVTVHGLGYKSVLVDA